MSDIVDRLRTFINEAPSADAPIRHLMRGAATEITTLRQQLEEAQAMRANAWIIEVDEGVMIARQGNISVTVAAETATVNVSESDAPAVKLKLDEFFPDKIQFAITSARALSASRASQGASTLTHETDTKPHTAPSNG